MEISPPLRSRRESCLFERREATPEDPILIGKEKGLHQGNTDTDATTVEERAADTTSIVLAVVDPSVIETCGG